MISMCKFGVSLLVLSSDRNKLDYVAFVDLRRCMIVDEELDVADTAFFRSKKDPLVNLSVTNKRYELDQITRRGDMHSAYFFCFMLKNI